MNINFSRRVPTCGSSSDGWHRLVIVRLVVSLGLCALMLPATLSAGQVQARPAGLSREAPAGPAPASWRLAVESGGPWVLQARLKIAFQSHHSGSFGRTVALSKDGRTALITDGTRTVNAKSEAGAVEVFRLEGTTWTDQAALNMGTAAHGGEYFGESVALSANGNMVLVGFGHGRKIKGKWHGAVEVFRFAGGHWGKPRELNLGQKAKKNDGFGFSVALSASGDTAAVGSDYDSVNGKVGAGSVYVFHFNGRWSNKARLSLGRKAARYDYFGRALAISADGRTILAGVPQFNVPRGGKAEVFHKGSAGWKLATLLPSVRVGQFGSWVGLSDDGNTAVIGAPGVGSQTKAPVGSAEVFTHNAGHWTQPVELRDPNAGRPQWFGFPVALSGDGKTAAVGSSGAPLTDGSYVGAVDVYHLVSGSWGVSADLPNLGYGEGLGGIAFNHDGGVLLAGWPRDGSNFLWGTGTVFTHDSGDASSPAVRR